jgi:hypothetical protein
MATRLIDRKTYDLLVSAYREEPGNRANAARVARCSWHMADRAWTHGWPRVSWAIPIRDVVGDERTAARALLAREAGVHPGTLQDVVEVQTLASADAAYRLAEEARGIRLAQQTTMGLLESLHSAISTRVPPLLGPSTSLDAPVAAAASRHASPLDGFEQLVRLNAQLIDQLGKAMQLERFRLGNPLPEPSEREDEVDPEDALIRIERVVRAHRLLRERDVIVYPEDEDPAVDTEPERDGFAPEAR